MKKQKNNIELFSESKLNLFKKNKEKKIKEDKIISDAKEKNRIHKEAKKVK